jgi:cytochrome c oxidase assembly factor CtaG
VCHNFTHCTSQNMTTHFNTIFSHQYCHLLILFKLLLIFTFLWNVILITKVLSKCKAQGSINNSIICLYAYTQHISTCIYVHFRTYTYTHVSVANPDQEDKCSGKVQNALFDLSTVQETEISSSSIFKGNKSIININNNNNKKMLG